MTTVRFHEALKLAAAVLNNPVLADAPRPRLVRDVYGRLRFAVDCPEAQYPQHAMALLRDVQSKLGVFATSSEVLSHDSFSFPQKVFRDSDWHATLVDLGSDEDGNPLGKVSVDLLDRQVTGQDWLRPVTEEHATLRRPHRIVFFGLKGGVGRSTALCMTAWGLARQGKRVLLIDFDLESPGLSGLVLPPSKVAEFGVVDWLVEDAVGQGDSVLPRMVAASPLSESTINAIRVAAAIGQGETDYLAKLARAYADVPSEDGPKRLGQRLRKLVEALEAQEQPDVVLIDSRAGLHDLAAVAITSLADTAMLFTTDGAQSWSGYRQLFSHWQQRPEIARRVRERLTIVRALTPKVGREAGVERFQQQAYDLFSETLYDEIPAGHVTGDADGDETLFHPDISDESAPHSPVLIDWDDRFQEFNPMLRPEDGGVNQAQIDATFGALIGYALERTEEGAE